MTGASGFLGRRLVDSLTSAGHDVSVLVRSVDQAPPGTRPVAGRLEDISSWESRLEGIDAVVHLASIIDRWGPWQRFETIIVEGTRLLLDAADRHGVRRFVHISSESVMQHGQPLIDVDETYPLPATASSFYGQAKLLAEKAVLGHRGDIETIILRPTYIWGPDSPPLHELADRARAGTMPLIDHGRHVIEHIHVDNAVAATTLALTHGKPRGVYLITNGEPMSARDFLSGVLGALGAPLPSRSLPSALAFPVARVGEGVWRGLHLSGRPPVTRFEVEFLALPRKFDITRARSELDYQPRTTFQDGLAGLARHS
ncbi:NAD-dependent epimerase/dehydratase family protein [Streptacidiphilus rugosus]|uniref:NAD-dependent epimerase/dehydratase family protein n=1 Tax=Streptacidiphilus rugosus TaxID=405783 RepID=UPI000A7EFD96|nr:NAD-dependent epimerase/dehydratase family protein [Streptacidiphilus rugosus]